MDNATITLTHEGITYIDSTPEQLAEAGVPANVIQQALDAQIIRQAEQQIDAIADHVYTVSPSRSARYQLKLAEAQRYMDAGAPAKPKAADYPYLTAEATARGITPKQLAQAILAAAQAMEAFGAIAEAARARLKTEVPGAADEAAKQAAAAAIVAEVQQAAAALQG